MLDQDTLLSTVDGPDDEDHTQPDLTPRHLIIADDDPTIETRALPDFGIDSGVHIIQPPRPAPATD